MERIASGSKCQYPVLCHLVAKLLRTQHIYPWSYRHSTKNMKPSSLSVRTVYTHVQLLQFMRNMPPTSAIPSAQHLQVTLGTSIDTFRSQDHFNLEPIMHISQEHKMKMYSGLGLIDAYSRSSSPTPCSALHSAIPVCHFVNTLAGVDIVILQKSYLTLCRGHNSRRLYPYQF